MSLPGGFPALLFRADSITAGRFFCYNPSHFPPLTFWVKLGLVYSAAKEILYFRKNMALHMNQMILHLCIQQYALHHVTKSLKTQKMGIRQWVLSFCA